MNAFNQNSSGEFLTSATVLLVGGELLRLKSPLDILGAAKIPVGASFVAVQIMIVAPGAFDFSRDGVNWVTQNAGLPLLLHAVRYIPRGIAAGTVQVPDVWVKGVGTIGILIHGDVQQVYAGV
jgi:hypothetical protein